MQLVPVHYTIVATDVVGSGRRDNELILRMRADLRRAVDESLASQGIDLAGLHTDDLGDGLRFLVPAEIPPAALVDRFISRLDAALQIQRRAASKQARLRLRVAIHHGTLHRDEDGWAGEPLRLCARLLDAEPVRLAVDLVSEANLVLVMSQAIYDSVVADGYVLEPASYRPVRVRVKETETSAWVHLPGFSLPADLERPPADSRRAGAVHVIARDGGTNFTVFEGNMSIYRTESAE